MGLLREGSSAGFMLVLIQMRTNFNRPSTDHPRDSRRTLFNGVDDDLPLDQAPNVTMESEAQSRRVPLRSLRRTSRFTSFAKDLSSETLT